MKCTSCKHTVPEDCGTCPFCNTVLKKQSPCKSLQEEKIQAIVYDLTILFDYNKPVKNIVKYWETPLKNYSNKTIDEATRTIAEKYKKFPKLSEFTATCEAVERLNRDEVVLKSNTDKNLFNSLFNKALFKKKHSKHFTIQEKIRIIDKKDDLFKEFIKLTNKIDIREAIITEDFNLVDSFKGMLNGLDKANSEKTD